MPPCTLKGQATDQVDQDAPIHIHSDGSEPDDTASETSMETVGSGNCDPQEPDAAPLLGAPDLAAVLATADVTQVLLADMAAPLGPRHHHYR